ncbi:unnamed protein product [Sphagnum troendelagicum]
MLFTRCYDREITEVNGGRSGVCVCVQSHHTIRSRGLFNEKNVYHLNRQRRFEPRQSVVSEHAAMGVLRSQLLSGLDGFQ